MNKTHLTWKLVVNYLFCHTIKYHSILLVRVFSGITCNIYLLFSFDLQLKKGRIYDFIYLKVIKEKYQNDKKNNTPKVTRHTDNTSRYISFEFDEKLS